MAAAWTFPIPLTWNTNTPVWVKQWPLKGESLQHAHALVQEQLQQGHLKLSTSPWNTPIFVIKKKSGKYRLLHDLRAVNAQIEPMGALQPSLPNPAMLPQHWPLLIVDLKDCFFTIALHPQDTPRFAFTLPAVNRQHPDQRFEWTVLPQGMRNSPTLCQLFVNSALQPLRQQWPQVIIYHYMDDLLFAQPQPFSDLQIHQIQQTLAKQALIVAPEKIQRSSPWKYLGWILTEQMVTPQKLQFHHNITTLHDAQKLLGDLQWLRPIIGIPNELIDQLHPLLKGTDPTQQVTVSPQQQQVIQLIAECILQGQVRWRTLDLPVDLAIWLGPTHFMGALVQHLKRTGEQWVLEWVMPPLQQQKTVWQKIELLSLLIKKGRQRVVQVMGLEPDTIFLPLQRDTLDWYLVNSAELQEALLSSTSTIAPNNSKPPLKWVGMQKWMLVPKRSDRPIPGALTVYTDAGKKSRKAAITWQKEGSWEKKMLSAEEADTLQTLELFAVVWAISHFREPINIVTDSLYVAGVVARIEDAFIKEVRNQRLYQLLMQLNKALHQREQPYAVIHIRSHKWNISLGEGNQRADELVSTAITVPLPQHVLAREAHSIFHQNAKGLQKEFQISHAEATAIVRSCPICCHHNGGLALGTGVNPRGVMANELWQADVTHVNSFGRLKYVHVTIDTYSHYIWATPQSGERAIHVIRHLTSCFAVMRVCRKLKTDNGAAYVSSRVQTFLKQWGVKHVTGIPHNPRGQAIVERANGTLKTYIEKFSHITDIQERVAKMLFVLNYLCVFGSSKDLSGFQLSGRSQHQNLKVEGIRNPQLT
ncbi:hypothetical protein DUI87_12093 [Hirundo rustica rustica]|uniref:Uncharacterized protein n=1 Tax=Hirundo rustica rustica TaxID=333673 RepID=A0A3M0KJJ0_HIRRU|nr:hypothetical protein DUI87_12093 [Hirundo rustica rustica]